MLKFLPDDYIHKGVVEAEAGNFLGDGLGGLQVLLLFGLRRHLRYRCKGLYDLHEETCSYEMSVHVRYSHRLATQIMKTHTNENKFKCSDTNMHPHRATYTHTEKVARTHACTHRERHT